MCHPVAPSGNGVTRSSGCTAPVPSVDTWVQWRYDWPASPGAHTLAVRATDGTGAVQPEERVTPFPDGATGWHTITVSVS